MTRRIMVIAPHPDDETLGCGGTLLRHAAAGDIVHWTIVTRMDPAQGFTAQRIEQRAQEVARIATAYGFAGVHELGFPTTRLDTIAQGDLVARLADKIRAVEPDTLYLPFRGDAHTDHAVVFDAAAACTKWFRYPSVTRVLCYEVLSETDFGLDPTSAVFAPTVFVDISAHLGRKLEIAAMFHSEMGGFPFPRSPEALRALAAVRGAGGGYTAAEAFVLLRERVS